MVFVFSHEFSVLCAGAKCYFCQSCIINLFSQPKCQKVAITETKVRELKGSELSKLENEKQKTAFELKEQQATGRRRNPIPLGMESDIAKAECVQSRLSLGHTEA